MATAPSAGVFEPPEKDTGVKTKLKQIDPGVNSSAQIS
jgi:hypothetical protein